MTRRAWSHVLLAMAVVISGLAIVQVATSPADAVDWAVSKQVNATRTHINEDGSVDKESATSNKVTVRVSAVKDLRGRQEVAVDWSGAHPTGGVVLDSTASEAKEQEYPVVILQCRGVDTAGAVPKGQARLSPETCWTQTAPERYLASSSQMPPWRADAFADDAERAPVVGAPQPLPDACTSLASPVTARWLPLRSASGDTYFGGPDASVGCVGTAPESNDAGEVGLPSNTTYGVTGQDGKGTAEFPVWTKTENATLGCSATVACALVVVPIVGMSCDAWGTQLKNPQLQSTGIPLTSGNKNTADTTCRKTGSYSAGESRDSTKSSDQAVRGSNWWSDSNWRNRVTVQLGFAPTDTSCKATGNESGLQTGGSVVMNELTASWRPTFCATSSLTAFDHIQQADFFALEQVDSGSLDAAFASAPPDFTFRRPVVAAPVTVGGFAIAFTIDDARKRRQETLNLNARLVAKLITQSYPITNWLRDDRTDLVDNPLNMSLDPEFIALNPGLKSDPDLTSAGAIQLMSDHADLTTALTAWVDADPEARAWLDGAADPWGMKVNTNYKNARLADAADFLRDSYMAPAWYETANKCYGNSPSPYLNLVSNPQTNLAAVALNLQYGNSAVLTACNFQTEDPLGSLPLRKQGRQSVGQRFVLGLVSLSSAKRFNLRTAALQTSSTVPAGEKFADAAGRTFVRSTPASLKAAAADLKVDKENPMWSVDHAALQAGSNKQVYPGIMPVYAAIPTVGLSDQTATGLAKLLCYAVDTKRGLRSGMANGRLPDGYLALSDANGLGAERAYTLKAVSAIRNQTKSVPALDAKDLSYDSVCDFRVVATKPTPTTKPTVDTPDTSVAPAVAPEEVAPTAVTHSPPAATPEVVLTSGQGSRLGSMGAPLLLLLALFAGLAGSMLRWSDQIAAATRRLRSSGGRRRQP